MAKSYRNSLELLVKSAIVGAKEALDFAPHAPIDDKMS